MPNQDDQNLKRRGLGRVIYSVDSEAVIEDRQAIEKESAEVDEASEESFPASDPPGYTGMIANPVDEDRKDDSG